MFWFCQLDLPVCVHSWQQDGTVFGRKFCRLHVVFWRLPDSGLTLVERVLYNVDVAAVKACNSYAMPVCRQICWIRSMKTLAMSSMLYQWIKICNYYEIVSIIQEIHRSTGTTVVSDIAVFVLTRDVKLQPTNSNYRRQTLLFLLPGNFCHEYGCAKGLYLIYVSSTVELQPIILLLKHILTECTTLRNSWHEYHLLSNINELNTRWKFYRFLV